MDGYSFSYEITNYSFTNVDTSDPIAVTKFMTHKIISRMNAKDILQSFKDDVYQLPPCNGVDNDKVYFKSENDFVMFKLMFEKLL